MLGINQFSNSFHLVKKARERRKGEEKAPQGASKICFLILLEAAWSGLL
jgi:hypothetical protein